VVEAAQVGSGSTMCPLWENEESCGGRVDVSSDTTPTTDKEETMIIEDEDKKTRLKQLLQDAKVLRRIHQKLLKLFAGWALEDPESQQRILEYKDQFKILVDGCLRAKGDVKEHEVVLALQIMAEEFTAAILLTHGTLTVEEVEVSAGSGGVH